MTKYLAKWTVPESEKASATFVGFANLPNQVFRKAVKRGFQFSLMVVGSVPSTPSSSKVKTPMSITSLTKSKTPISARSTSSLSSKPMLVAGTSTYPKPGKRVSVRPPPSDGRMGETPSPNILLDVPIYEQLLQLTNRSSSCSSTPQRGSAHSSGGSGKRRARPHLSTDFQSCVNILTRRQ